MRSLIGVAFVATVFVACGQAPQSSESNVQAAKTRNAVASETLSYTVSYLGASQQGQASFSGGKVTVRIKNLPRGQSGQMLIELASGSTKKYVGRLNALQVSDKVSTKRLLLSKSVGAAAPVQTAAQQNEGVLKRRAKYCGNGGNGGDGGLDDGRFGGDGDDFNGRFGEDDDFGRDDDDRFDGRGGRGGNNGRNGRNGRNGDDDLLNDDRFFNNGRNDGRLKQQANVDKPSAPAAQEGEMILELVAPKG